MTLPSLVAASLLAALLSTQGVGVEVSRGETPAALDTPASVEQAPALQGWIARTQDNVCGLSNPRQLSSPSQVDFPSLLADTEEMRRMRRDRIDPNSPQGIQLHNAARSRVAGACEAVMTEQGHCSVWKAIRHSDGRPVPDLTEMVRQRL